MSEDDINSKSAINENVPPTVERLREERDRGLARYKQITSKQMESVLKGESIPELLKSWVGLGRNDIITSLRGGDSWFIRLDAYTHKKDGYRSGLTFHSKVASPEAANLRDVLLNSGLIEVGEGGQLVYTQKGTGCIAPIDFNKTDDDDVVEIRFDYMDLRNRGYVEPDELTEDALKIVELLLPKEDNLRIRLLEQARLVCGSQQEKILETANKTIYLLEDSRVVEALDEETRKSLELINKMVPTERRGYAFQILEHSSRRLADAVYDESRIRYRDLGPVIDYYINSRGRMCLSRAADYLHGGLAGELAKISKREHARQVFGALIDPQRGETYSTNRIYYHFGDWFALQCKFYLGDVDHPDSPVKSLDDYLSFPDAKLLFAIDPLLIEGRTGEGFDDLDLTDIAEIGVCNEDQRREVIKLYPATQVFIARMVRGQF